MQQNATAAGAPSRTLLGELTALPQTPSWFLRGPLRGGEGRGRDRKGRKGWGDSL